MQNQKLILYMELLENNYGNKKLDQSIIKLLSVFTKVIVVSPKNWFTLDASPNIELIEYEPTETFINCIRFQSYFNHYDILNCASKMDKQYKFDYIFFASYHTSIMALVSLKLKQLERVFILHHNNIDNIDKSQKQQLLFKLYGNKLNHFVFESFIGNHLEKKYKIDKSRIFVLPHPLNTVDRFAKKVYDCVGISNSNSEQWIKEIINKEKSENIFMNNQKHVILRSKELEFDNGFLKIIKGNLPEEEYYNYIKQAQVIFLPFPNSFRYRMSGSIVDAFSNNTIVIGNKIPIFESYELEFPNICHTITTSEYLIRFIIAGAKITSAHLKEFQEFQEKHSDIVIEKELRTFFGD